MKINDYCCIKVPKRYGSSKWNNMKVMVIGFDGKHVLTKNKKGKVLRFYYKWLVSIDRITNQK